MSLQNYKKLGIEHFYKKDFHTAKMYFSLAYKKRKNKRLLNFISLCDLALKNMKDAFFLFEFYLDNYKMPNVDKDFEGVLSSFESEFEEAKEEEFGGVHALSYRDFLKSEENIGFQKSFENVVFGTKLIIDDKEDFLDFLEKLLENGYKDMTLSYIESLSSHFWANDRFIKLQEKLIGFKSEIKA